MAKDPYKYFRVEARELLEGLNQGILQLEKHTTPETIAYMLRLAHTLKGAARVVKQPKIAENAHKLEDILAHTRDAGGALLPADCAQVLQFLDESALLLKELEPVEEGVKRPSVAPAAAAAPVESLDVLRVEISEMDALLRGLAELSIRLEALTKRSSKVSALRKPAADLLRVLSDEAAATQHVVGLERGLALAEELQAQLELLQRNLALDVEGVSRQLDEIRDAAGRMRLVQAQSIFPSLERTLRDAAQALGKRVRFETRGGDERLDATVLLTLRDALTHVVRNAVAHGIESESDRLALGKDGIGSVKIVVERRGNRIAFSCSDDGRGVDWDAVKRQAVAQGALSKSAAETVSPAELQAFLTRGGISTSGTVTELSGRGVGLDVLRSAKERLKGDVAIHSETGRGTRISIEAPLLLASFQGLLVEAAGYVSAIPLDALECVFRVKNSEVTRTSATASVLLGNKLIPFWPLERTLERVSNADFADRMWSAVVVRAGERSAAIGVDRLLGTASTLMRPLPGCIAVDAAISGAGLDADGNPVLVLDPQGLIAAAERGAAITAAPTVQSRDPILVIDDSLTTRMLEQSILESAGYEVELAVSAEEALAKARLKRYELFMVDVEMPGMDGFTFVAQTRADPELRQTPAILMTSLNAPADRARGAQAGASAYIVKSEFDQVKLLQTIRNLIG